MCFAHRALLRFVLPFRFVSSWVVRVLCCVWPVAFGFLFRAVHGNNVSNSHSQRILSLDLELTVQTSHLLLSHGAGVFTALAHLDCVGCDALACFLVCAVSLSLARPLSLLLPPFILVCAAPTTAWS